ncbi:hypothetical protein O6H91_20G069200 [Diphasiastrum complanatum]|uniref:Uncharacterized protein n=1 Tax=Diphasiastrum complanatum TaxID=34168 RepID=A0ACC2AT16_DIPCM|nr:hypothetical protein O6H91_20G069200 [Diphasiastrum complanatum]
MKEKKFVCERSKATPSVRPREPKAASNHSNKEEGKRPTFHIASKEDDQSSSISVPSPCMQNNSPSSRHAALRNACALSLPLLQERLGWLGVDDSILRKSYRTYQFTDLRLSKNIIENRKGISVAPHSDPSQVPASDGLSPFSRALQEKMAHLEGRVNQLAAELKQTKEQLSEKNPSSSRKAFIDIQSRIVRLEKLLAIKLAENGLLPSVGVMDCLTDTKDEAKAVALEAGNEDVGPSVSIQRDENHPTKSARFSASESPRKTAGIGLSSTREATKVQLSQSRIEHDNLDGLCLDDKGQTELGSCHDNLEERLFPHVALMKNKPALHQKLMESRAALHQRLVDNRALLRRKLAALEGREAADDSTHPDGDVIAAEFLASLKQARDLGMQRQKMAKIKALISGAMPPQMSCLGQTSMEEPLDFNGTLEALPISLPQSNPSLQKAQGIITSGSAASYEQTVLSIDDPKEEPLSTYDGYILNQIIEDTLESTEGPRLTNTACRKTSETKFANRGSGGNLDCGGNMENNSIQSGCSNASVNLECEENISDDAANDQENVVPDIEHFQCVSQEEYEDGMLPDSPGRLFQLGEKIATAGWFVSDGEGLLLAHEDSGCSFHDVANMEEKSRYCGPSDIAPSAWRDCWLIRAAGSDGRSNRYIVAASAGGALNSGFCCWDFYDKAITGYHWETQSCHTTPSDWYCSNDSISSTSDNISPSRQQLSSHLVPYDSETNGIRHRNEKPSTLRGKVPGSSRHSANTLSMDLDYPLWWYRPCGPLLASGGTGLKMVTFYDIRDGDMVMKWETRKSITSMEFSSPLQWRNKDKLVVAEEEAISLWDVNTTEARCLHNVNSAGKQLHALHILNSDAEVSGGVRQRIGSSETKGMDGVFCSEEAVNVLDFRVPIGIVMKIPIFGEHVDSVFTQGDAIFAAATSKLETTYSTTRIQCSVHQWSIRTGKPMVTYTLPESSAHYSHLSLAQVWGSDDAVMTANGNGLYIFDCFKGLTGQLAGRDPIKAFQAPKGCKNYCKLLVVFAVQSISIGLYVQKPSVISTF